jgi:hypothetical protein
MLRMGKESKLNPQEVVEKAKAFFGPGGIGLEVIERGSRSVEFSGGGGFVLLKVSPIERGSDIEIQTREWDYDVKRFLGDL